jgi:hypothetical protein
VFEGKSESQPEQSKLKNLGTFDIPEWSLNYLENGDATNLTDEEVANVNAFTKEHFPNGFVMNIDFENSTELNRYPAFGPRNEEALTSKGESPFLATKTYPVTFYDARDVKARSRPVCLKPVGRKGTSQGERGAKHRISFSSLITSSRRTKLKGTTLTSGALLSYLMPKL